MTVITALHKFRSNVFSSKFFRNTVILAGGNVLRQLVLLQASPFISLLYTPSDLAYLTLYLNFVSVAQVITTLCFETATVSAQDNQDAAYLAWLALFCLFPFSLISVFILFLLIRFNWLGYGNLPAESIPLVLLSLLLTSLFLTLRCWNLRENQTQLISHVSFLQNATRALTQVALRFLHLSWVALISGDVLGRSVRVLVMAQP